MAGSAAAEQGKPKEKTKPAGHEGASAARARVARNVPLTRRAPVIASVSATPNALGAPNHKMTPVSITAQVTDNCTAVTWSVTSIASNEPVNGTGDGDSAPDWTIAGAHGVSLRAERAGTGSGRTYTITITAKDAAGNASTGTTTVAVPHNK